MTEEKPRPRSGLKARLVALTPRCPTCGGYVRSSMWSLIGISEREYFDFMNGQPVYGDAIERIRKFVDAREQEQAAGGGEPQQERS